MSGLNGRTILAAAIAGISIFALTASAQAHDGDRWERDRWEHKHRHENRHERHVEHRYHHEPRFVPERSVVYERERPVYVQPAPVYQQMMPMYQQPQDQGVNLNFTIPLR